MKNRYEDKKENDRKKLIIIIMHTQSNHAIQCYIHIHPRWHYDELSQESKSRWGYEVLVVYAQSIHPEDIIWAKWTAKENKSKSRWGYEVWKPTSSWRWTQRECWWPSNIIILSELVNVKYHHCIRTGQCLATFLFFFHSPMQQVYIVQNKSFHSLPLPFYCNLLCCFIQTSMIILIVGWCGWWDGRRHRFYWAKAWPIYCLSLQVLKYIHWLPESSWLLQRLTIMLP